MSTFHVPSKALCAIDRPGVSKASSNTNQRSFFIVSSPSRNCRGLLRGLSERPPIYTAALPPATPRPVFSAPHHHARVRCDGHEGFLVGSGLAGASRKRTARNGCPERSDWGKRVDS